MKLVRVIHHSEADSWWAESPDVERWYAAGDTYDEVFKLAEEGIPLVLGHDVTLEHFVPPNRGMAA